MPCESKLLNDRSRAGIWTPTDSSAMLHSFEEMIAYVSRGETLRAGKILRLRDVGGGRGLELDRWLKHGDVVEFEVERIGVLNIGDIRIASFAQSSTT